MKQEMVILTALIGATVIGYGYVAAPAVASFFSAGPSSAATSVSSSSTSVEQEPRDQPVPTAAPQDDSYRGKIANLPEAAKAVLEFTPADNAYQTNSESILERVASDCGLTDYVGSDEFPGKIWVSSPKPLGWVGVTWKPGRCNGIGGGEYPHPTLSFDISANRQHIKYLGGANGATYYLTH